MAVFGYLFLIYRQKKLAASGEVFTEPEEKQEISFDEKLPNAWISLLPLVVVLLSFNLLGFHIIAALLSGNVLILALNYKKFKGYIKAINEGAKDSLLAIMNTSAAVGFGAVVQSVPAFNDLANMLTDIPGSPLVSLAITVNLLAGVTGSASGGLGIALTALGEQYYTLALQTGISPEALHRVASLSSGVLDLMPHNGVVLTMFAVTGLTHKECYKDLALTAIAIPLIALIAAITLASLGIY
jgi:H+/gluconate symporter-like permease